MEPKQKFTAAAEETALVPREVEALNGYYKKVVLESSFAPAFAKATAGKPRRLEGLSLKVFNDRYALKSETGEQLEHTPEQMWRRVASFLAKVEATEEKKKDWEKKFYWALEDFKFVTGGRIMAGAGNKGQVTFYNCYVLPSPDDSRGGIMDSVKNMVEIMARGGGVGVNLSSLRPRGSFVKGVNGKASGSVSFGALYSFATGLVIQGGSRRGALMLMLNDDHPDIEEFITVKRTMGQITNANLSVSVSDRFMETLKCGGDWDLQWAGKVFKTVKAQYLWDLITESAHASGEPGCVFMERANKESNTWYFEDIVCVNPCGEQPLPAWGVCNLGSINLAAFAEEGEIQWEKLGQTINIAIRLMDNVIDATPYAFEENRQAQFNVRRTGLGTMGLADFLIKLKIRYGSDEAVAVVKDVYRFMRDESYRSSIEVAAEKGAFPDFDSEKYLQGAYIRALPADVREGIKEHGIRNAVLQTQAPTGTTSILAGVSSGIEPVYDFAFKRTDRLGQHIVYHPLYQKYVEERPNEPVPDYFVNAKQLTPMEHVKMQAIIQQYTDASISKTVNAPEEHTHEQVKELYIKAYDLGCKGVTYYRENSRDVSVLESLDKAKKSDGPKKLTQEQSGNYVVPAFITGAAAIAKEEIAQVIEPRDRPEVMSGKTYKLRTGDGVLYVTVNNTPDNKPFEVFAAIGKAGGFFAANSEAICRLASLALRSGITVEEVIKQLKGIRGPMPTFGPNGAKILSLPDAIAHILERHINPNQPQLKLDYAALPAKKIEIKNESIANNGHAPECPECGGDLVMGEGCFLCRNCGYSKCG